MFPRIAGICLASLLWATPSLAQSGTSPAPESKIGGRIFVHFDAQSMAAKDTFETVTGSTTLLGGGGGVEVHRLWRRLFVRADLSRFVKLGERVFVVDGEVFPLGTELEVTMTPIALGAGWRFSPIGSRGIVPYLGAGLLFLKYREVSDADVSGEEVSETYDGFTIFGGIEVPVWRALSAGAELGWRRASVSPLGGVMQAFGESNLGGTSIRVMVSLRK